MYNDVGSLETIIDEIGGLMEKLANVTSFMVIDRDVKEIGDVCPGVSKVDSLGRGEDSLDL